MLSRYTCCSPLLASCSTAPPTSSPWHAILLPFHVSGGHSNLLSGFLSVAGYLYYIQNI